MNKKTIMSLLNLFAAPVLLIVLGLILIVNPDSASALITKILGWALILGGAVSLYAAMTGDTGRRATKAIPAVVCLLVGIYFVTNPLALAKWLGRILGIVLAVQGAGEIAANWKERQSADVLCPSMILAVVTTVVGIILILLPMTTSRLLFMICGIVLLVIGAAELLDRLKDKKRLEDGEKPHIIDADE